MPWECVECSDGMMICGDPKPSCSGGPHVDNDDWEKIGCYCLAIMRNKDSGDIALKPMACKDCQKKKSDFDDDLSVS